MRYEYQVPCPRCGAAVGQQCYDLRGQRHGAGALAPIKQPHRARLTAFTVATSAQLNDNVAKYKVPPVCTASWTAADWQRWRKEA